MRNRQYVLIGSALLLTALLLFVVVPAVAKLTSSHYSLGFADGYDKLAYSLASGQGYRFEPGLSATMMREPGYPLFLAGLFKLAGYRLEAARMANLLLAGAAALLLWHLALRISHDEATGLVAVVLFLLHPGTLVAEARGGVEILFTFGILAFTLLLYRAIDADRGRHYFLAGVVLGAVVLIRSTPLLFPLVLVPYLVLSAPGGARGRRIAHCVLLAVGMGLMMSPWIARNYALSGQFVPTATVQGVAAQEGLYTCERLSFGRGFAGLQGEAGRQRDRLASELGLRFKGGYYQHFYSVADEHAFNRALLESASARYRENPGLLARCVGTNLLYFWFLGKNGLATALNVALQLPILLLALAGLCAVWRSRPGKTWIPIALFMAYLFAVHLPLIAHARHSIPLIPFLAIFAAPIVVAAWRRFAGGRALAPASVRG